MNSQRSSEKSRILLADGSVKESPMTTIVFLSTLDFSSLESLSLSAVVSLLSGDQLLRKGSLSAITGT
jgi:hypothetical protein